MCKEEIMEIAKAAATEAIKAKDDILQEEFDMRYQDVKLLMKNYRKLRTYYDEMAPEMLEVSSVCSMRRKTGLMMSHVNKMLSAYKVLCEESEMPEEIRRWEVLYLRYIADKGKTIEEIAEQFGIDRRTFYRDINRAVEDMAVLLFGIEAIGSWKHKNRSK